MKPKIYIVLPVFNRLNFSKKCIKSIYNQTYKNFELIVVNDGSTDGTQEFINRHYPQTTIIKGNGKWWWTKSMHEGTKLALKSAKKQDFILEMNNDLFFDQDYFQSLITCAKKYKKSIIGSLCVLAQKPSEVVEAGVRIDWPTGLVYGVAQTISNKLSYYKNMKIVDNLDALPGKGTLIPMDVFRKNVNFRYKLLPHYIADYEFAINAKRHGFNLIICTRAIAKHYWEATGISSNRNDEKRSYHRAFSLLFGRKSMNNIIDWIIFINLACPKKYIKRNYYFSFLKLTKALLTVFPFYYLRPIIRVSAKMYHFYRLNLYRTYLKITQFKEYHLKAK